MDVIRYLKNAGNIITAGVGLYILGKTCYNLGLQDGSAQVDGTVPSSSGGSDFYVKRERDGFKVTLV